jgi:hypothetical protein
MSLLPTLSLIAGSFLLGAMLFFVSVTAPAIFKFLPEDSRPLILSGIFPRYYSWCAIVSLVTTAFSIPVFDEPRIIFAIITFGFIVLRFGLIPKIEKLRAQRESGDEIARIKFAKLHRLSVCINLAQMVAAISAMVLMILVGI